MRDVRIIDGEVITLDTPQRPAMSVAPLWRAWNEATPRGIIHHREVSLDGGRSWTSDATYYIAVTEKQPPRIHGLAYLDVE